MENKNICAPVIIPTLNRLDHLSNCINSLRVNELAKDTELYIGVDYPPTDKYREGYEKICRYLDEGIDGFKKVHVIKRNENYGSFKNTEALKDEVFKIYDRFIFTEDDNVFSPNFLSYMNQSLEIYKEDDSVAAVCGYMWPTFGKSADELKVNEQSDVNNLSPLVDSVSNDTVRISSIFSAWGYGSWKDTDLLMREEINIDNFSALLKNHSILKQLKSVNPFIYSELIKGFLEYAGCLINKDGKINIIDLSMGFWMFATNRCMIYPLLSKVRNNGNDNSGEHCVDFTGSGEDNLTNRSFDYSKQEIDNECLADIGKGASLCEIREQESADCQYNPKVSEKLKAFLLVPSKEILRVDISYLVMRILGRKRTGNLLKKL